MYDKVKMFLPRTRATPDITPFLDGGRVETDIQTGEVSGRGYVCGLRVSMYLGGISILGSLAKVLYPSNIYPLDRHTTKDALTKLSDVLHLDLTAAKVTGLEFGTAFVMSKPVETYLQKMGEMPRLQRYHFEQGTLYYKHRGKQQPKVFCFYDKKADAEAKGLELPTGLEEANLLKYELRLNGRLPHQIGWPEVQASTLYDSRFYRRLVDMWQQYYFSINKLNSVKTNIMCEIKTVGDAFNVLVARLINQDQRQIAEFLEELKANRVFDDRKYYTRLKDKIFEVANKASVSVSDEDIRELDNEIRNAGAYV